MRGPTSPLTSKRRVLGPRSPQRRLASAAASALGRRRRPRRSASRGGKVCQRSLVDEPPLAQDPPRDRRPPRPRSGCATTGSTVRPRFFASCTVSRNAISISGSSLTGRLVEDQQLCRGSRRRRRQAAPSGGRRARARGSSCPAPARSTRSEPPWVRLVRFVGAVVRGTRALGAGGPGPGDKNGLARDVLNTSMRCDGTRGRERSMLKQPRLTGRGNGGQPKQESDRRRLSCSIGPRQPETLPPRCT